MNRINRIGRRTLLAMSSLAIVALAVTLAGCGVMARMEDRQEYVKARQQYEESTAGYRSCLGINQANPRTCEAQRLAMESDERAFNNISGHAANINVQQR
jgi:ABC-type uncharacterized transport system auxiliary subunit